MDKQIDRFLLDYFNKNLKKGYKIEDLKIILIKQGYLRSDIDRVISIIREKTKKDQEERERLEKERNAAIEVFSEEPPRKRGFFKRLLGID